LERQKAELYNAPITQKNPRVLDKTPFMGGASEIAGRFRRCNILIESVKAIVEYRS
jgi:hypothetical protein